MLWKTHIRITFDVFKKLEISLSNLEATRLREGVIAPDTWGDYPHHFGKSYVIEQNLLTSRDYFLREDFLNAYFYLGVSLHYIQDSYTSMASFYPTHHSWEESIENCSLIPNLEETIQHQLRNKTFERNRCLGLANALTKEVQGKDGTLYIATLAGVKQERTFAKPIIDFNLGYRASYLVAKSVLSPRNDSQLDLALKQSLENHKTFLQNAELAISSQIIEMAEQVENLENRRINKSGIISKMKNLLFGLRVEIKSLQLNSKCDKYFQKRHFIEVSNDYKKAVDKIVCPYVGWNNYSIPGLNLNFVKSELIPIQEENGSFGVPAETIEQLVKERKLSFYPIGNHNLVSRRELDQIIS